MACEGLIKCPGVVALLDARLPPATERVGAELEFCGARVVNEVGAGRTVEHVAAGARVWELAP